MVLHCVVPYLPTSQTAVITGQID
jgi:hypothetical protein